MTYNSKRNGINLGKAAVVIRLLLFLPVFVAADWSVTIDGVYGQSIDFSTGNDGGAIMKVEIFDVCRVDSATRSYLGELYPSSTVYGLDADTSAVVNNPGCCNRISYSFNSAINTTSMYTDNGDYTAAIKFCAQVALYDGGSNLINLAEVRVEYFQNLITQEILLNYWEYTSAAGYTEAADTFISFDGTLYAYFCDPWTFLELYDDGYKTTQGSTISVCFKVPDGQFEIKDVMYLTVANADTGDPWQDIVSDSTIVSTATTAKTCYDYDTYDTNVCVVQFLLRGEFFVGQSIYLTGSGYVLLEFGDSPGTRALLTSGADDTSTSSASRSTPKTRTLKSAMAPFQVEPQDFVVVPKPMSGSPVKHDEEMPSRISSDESASPSEMALKATMIATGSVIGLLLFLCLVYSLLARKVEEKMDDSSTLNDSALRPSELDPYYKVQARTWYIGFGCIYEEGEIVNDNQVYDEVREVVIV